MTTYNVKTTDYTVRFNTTADSATAVMQLFANTPNQEFLFQKLTGDTNTVTVKTSGSDTFPDGSTTIVLTDNTVNYFTKIKITTGGAVIESGVGAPGGGITPIGTPIPGAALTVTGVETGPRYSDPSNEGVHTIIQLIPVITTGSFPMNITFWMDFDDGNGPVPFATVLMQVLGESFFFGQATWNTQGALQSGNIWVPTNPANTNWVVYAAPGVVASPTPIVGAVSYGFTVAAVGACPATDISNAAFLTNPVDGDILTYTLSNPGIYLWNYFKLQFTQPSLSQDYSYWFSLVTVQKGYATSGTVTVSGGTTLSSASGLSFSSTQVGYLIHVGGVPSTIASYISSTSVTIADVVANGSGIAVEVWNPAPDYEGVNDDIDVGVWGRWHAEAGAAPGTQTTADFPTTVTINGDYPPDWTDPLLLNIDGSPNLYRTYRFWIYAGSRLGTDATNPNPQTFTLQTCWPGGADHFDVNPAAQPPALDLTQVNPYTYDAPFSGGGGLPLAMNIAAPLYTDISNALNLKIASDFVVTGGVLNQAVVDLAKSVNYDLGTFGSTFAKSSGVLYLQALAVNNLVAGTALFAGTATFANAATAAAVQVGAAGIVLMDSYLDPGVTVAISFSGATFQYTGQVWNATRTYAIGELSTYLGIPYLALAAGSGHQPNISPTYWFATLAPTVKISPSGVEILGNSGQLQFYSTGLEISDISGNSIHLDPTGLLIESSGPGYVRLTSTSVDIIGGTFTCTLNGISTIINNSTFGSVAAGVQISNSTFVFSAAPATVGLYNPSGVSLATLNAASGIGTKFGRLVLQTDSTGQSVVITSNNPTAGSAGSASGQYWQLQINGTNYKVQLLNP